MFLDLSYLLLIGLVIAVSVLFFLFRGLLSREAFSHFGQGIVGLAASYGVVFAAWVFFVEHQDKPRVALATGATIVTLDARQGAERRALVQLVTTIENKGRRPLEVRCAGLNALGISAENSLPRDPQFLNDLLLQPLLADTRSGSAWTECMKFEAERLKSAHPHAEFATPASGFRYKTFFLEPGEARTRHFELVVPCSLAAVRFVVHLPKPNEFRVYETKRIVPLTEACADNDPNSSSLPTQAEPVVIGATGS